MRRDGLILENLDGFDQPGVLRSVPHTLGMRLTIASDPATNTPAGATEPLAAATGWSGDGSPFDGSLRNFAVGAVVQHFPKTLERRAGRDFRLPTEDELDALEAFQLSLGRQVDDVNFETMKYDDVNVDAGRKLFFDKQPVLGAGTAQPAGATRDCDGCHGNAGANNGSRLNQNSQHQRCPRPAFGDLHRARQGSGRRRLWALPSGLRKP